MRALSYIVVASLLIALFYVVSAADEHEVLALTCVFGLAALIAVISDAIVSRHIRR